MDVEVSSLGRDGARPGLAPVGRDCQEVWKAALTAGRTTDWPARRLGRISEAGTWYLAVAADTTRFRLQTGFADFDKLEEEMEEWDEDSAHLEEEMEEWDEDSAHLEEEMEEWDEDSAHLEEEMEEWDEDSIVRTASGRLAVCPRSLADDAGETLACGREIELGTTLRAVLLDGRVADRDGYVFEISDHETVVLRTRGGVDTYGELFDERGRRLAADDDGGGDGNFLIVRALPPGRYLLRVEGTAGAQGPYLLRTSSRARLTPPLRAALAGAGPTDDHGDHCRAASRAESLMSGRWDGPADVDVFRLRVPEAGLVAVAADGASVRLELKAADCRTSLAAGAGSAGLFTSVPAGVYFLYASGAGEAYRLALESVP